MISRRHVPLRCYRLGWGLAWLIVCALLPLRAVDTAGDEEKALHAAEQSYHDGAFALCNNRAAALLKKYPKTALLPQASLLQAQALYQLGRSSDALAALNLPPSVTIPPTLQPDFLFWQAETLLDLDRWPEAEQKYRALLALKDPAGHTEAATLGLAWAVFKQGREPEAVTLAQTLIRDHPNTVPGQQARLLQGKIDLAKGHYAEAENGFKAVLNDKIERGLFFETNYWLAEAYAAGGQLDAAEIAYRKVTDDHSAFPKPLVAQAYLGLGRVEHALHQHDLALPAFEQTYKLTENESIQLEAFRSYLTSARAADQLPEAITHLQEFAKGAPNSAPAALYAIGVALADNGDDDKAIGILDALQVAYRNSSWTAPANYQLGVLYLRAGKTDQATQALQACIAGSKDSALIRSAHFQLGYLMLKQLKDYTGAAAQFSLVAGGTDSTAEDASYNLLLTQSYLGDLDGFTKALADFNHRFPKSGHARDIALAQGQLLTNAGKADEAKSIYQQALSLAGKDASQLALLKALADLQYQTNDLEGTLATCKQIVDQFPQDALAAAQRSILVSFEMKKISENEVERSLIDLAQKYKDVAGAPEAYFRLGEFYSYRQDYVKAQEAFLQLAQNYPSSSYVDTAYFFAGRAAFAHQDYATALALFDKVSDSSSFKPQARLWTGRVYQEHQEERDLAKAIEQFNLVLATEKTGSRFVEASLHKGECLFEMGSKSPATYDQAYATFNQILTSKQGSIADRNEAAVRAAKCLEKSGKTDEALGLYLDVLYGRIAGDDSASTAPPEFSWQIEGGWQAARIRENQKDWRGAIEVYKRLEQIGGPHQQEFHDLINKLRRDNYIYE